MCSKTFRRGLCAAALFFGLSMLTSIEAAGLNVHGENPQLMQVIAQLASNRPVVVARTAPFLIDSGNSETLVLTYTFQPYELSIGDQIRVTFWGQAINNNAGNSTISAVGFATNGNPSTLVQIANVPPIQVASAGGGNVNAYVIFRMDFLFSIGIPGATLPGQNYVPSINATSGKTNTSVYATNNQPANTFSIFGGATGFVTDASNAGAVVTGGRFITGASGSGGGGMRRQITFDNSLPTEIDFYVNSGSNFALFPVSILAGSIEVL